MHPVNLDFDRITHPNAPGEHGVNRLDTFVRLGSVCRNNCLSDQLTAEDNTSPALKIWCPKEGRLNLYKFE
jgi:hypothetical protein